MKVTFFDTESTDLSASWGRILCASFVGLDGDVYTLRGDNKRLRGKTLIDDSGLAVAIRNELEKADIVCGWNSILHDIPLLNARLALVSERPCELGEKYRTRHLDMMYYAGGVSMKVGGRKLDTIAKYFQCENQKTELDGEIWQLAATGDKKSLDIIVKHCEADVLVLRDLWPYIAPHVSKITFQLRDVWHLVEHIGERED